MIKEINIGDTVYVEDHSDINNVELLKGVVLRYEVNRYYNKEGWVIRVNDNADFPIVIRSLPEFIHPIRKERDND